MRKIAVSTAAAVVATLGLMSGATPAQALPAGTYVYSCYSGGFTGSIRVTVSSPSAQNVATVYQVHYRILKGSNSGGNQANVYFTDDTSLPGIYYYSGDNGIQDGNYHYVTGNYGHAGPRAATARFIFDKANATDPECTVSVRII